MAHGELSMCIWCPAFDSEGCAYPCAHPNVRGCRFALAQTSDIFYPPRLMCWLTGYKQHASILWTTGDMFL